MNFLDDQSLSAGPKGNRELILEAARREIARTGSDRVSMRAVARAARVDPRLVRYYFPDRRHLVSRALAGLDLGTATGAEEDLPGSRPLAARACQDRPLEWRALLAGALSEDPAARGPLMDAIDQLLAARPDRDESARMRVLIAVSQRLGVWLLDGVTADEGQPAPNPPTQHPAVEQERSDHD